MSDDVFSEVLYRMAYGAATRLAEEHRQVADWGDASSVAAGILATVSRQLGRDPVDPEVRDAVEDALAGRRPRR